jgi:hypothetical protein
MGSAFDVAGAEAAPAPGLAGESATLRRRLLGAVVLATATVTLVLAVPPLHGVARVIDQMDPAWVAVVVAAEVGSCVCYVVIFRLFFDQVPAGAARELAWTEEASGALLPAGGVGALAIGGWLLRQSGMSTTSIVERSSALFFLTSAANVAALLGGGAMLATGAMGGRDTLALAGIPLLIAITSTAATLAVPIVLHRTPDRAWPTWLVDIAAGIDGARRALLAPNWRLLGAIDYLGFDIAALGAAFAATRHTGPDRRAGARLDHRLHRQHASGPWRLRRPRGRPRRRPDRLRSARHPCHRRSRRLPRDRVLDPKPRRPDRLRTATPQAAPLRYDAIRRQPHGLPLRTTALGETTTA